MNETDMKRTNLKDRIYSKLETIPQGGLVLIRSLDENYLQRGVIKGGPAYILLYWGGITPDSQRDNNRRDGVIVYSLKPIIKLEQVIDAWGSRTFQTPISTSMEGYGLQRYCITSQSEEIVVGKNDILKTLKQYGLTMHKKFIKGLAL